MPTSLRRIGKFFNGVVVEVPGWPDAPKWVRFRRGFPLLLPAALALLLIAASEFVHKPYMNAVRREHANLLAIEDEIEDMRFRWSDQRAAELEEHARTISGRLLPSALEVEGFLAGFRSEFESLGWDFRYQAYDAPTGAPEGGIPVVFAPVLVRMTALKDNKSPLDSLLKSIHRLGSAGPRVDFTRLSIAAGDNMEPIVEMNLRIACAVNHEKAAE